jgi:glutaredoxin
MKKIILFTIASCPYCIEALRCMDALCEEDARYKDLEIDNIDERVNPDLANQYDYYYVPTFYLGGTKLHEGAANMDAIRQVFDKALDGTAHP